MLQLRQLLFQEMLYTETSHVTCPQAVMLDEVMQAGLQPAKQHVVQFETRSLRDTRQLLSSVSLPDAMQFIEQNSHPRC